VLSIDKNIKHAIIEKATAGKLRVMGVKGGMRTLRMDAVEKMKSGITTLEEVTRVTAEDDLEVQGAIGELKAGLEQKGTGEGHSA
jgi:general secretion pathway protein E